MNIRSGDFLLEMYKQSFRIAKTFVNSNFEEAAYQCYFISHFPTTSFFYAFVIDERGRCHLSSVSVFYGFVPRFVVFLRQLYHFLWYVMSFNMFYLFLCQNIDVGYRNSSDRTKQRVKADRDDWKRLRTLTHKLFTIPVKFQT